MNNREIRRPIGGGNEECRKAGLAERQGKETCRNRGLAGRWGGGSMGLMRIQDVGMSLVGVALILDGGYVLVGAW